SARRQASRLSLAPACKAIAHPSSSPHRKRSVNRSSMLARSMALAVLVGCGDERDRGSVALGANVYAQNCAACHGAKLEGQPDWRRRLPNGRLPAPPHDERLMIPSHPGLAVYENGK